jgi:hypothetical protein
MRLFIYILSISLLFAPLDIESGVNPLEAPGFKCTPVQRYFEKKHDMNLRLDDAFDMECTTTEHV